MSKSPWANIIRFTKVELGIQVKTLSSATSYDINLISLQHLLPFFCTTVCLCEYLSLFALFYMEMMAF